MTDVGPVAPPTLMASGREHREVEPGFLTVWRRASRRLSRCPRAAEPAGDTALARSLTSPDNPLTARSWSTASGSSTSASDSWPRPAILGVWASRRRTRNCSIGWPAGSSNTKDPLLDAFDAADPFSSTDRRNVTTTPTQSLLMINGPWPLKRARPGNAAAQAACGQRDGARRSGVPAGLWTAARSQRKPRLPAGFSASVRRAKQWPAHQRGAVPPRDCRADQFLSRLVGLQRVPVHGLRECPAGLRRVGSEHRRSLAGHNVRPTWA